MNDNIKNMAHKIREMEEEALRKRLDDVVDETIKQYLKELDSFLHKELFKEAIDKFYKDYKPKLYTRARPGSGNSLYDVPQTEINEEENTMYIWFEEGNAPPFSSGYNGEDGVYDQSFRKGWHGGYGGSIRDDNGTHIASLRPRWRKGRFKNKQGKYVYRYPGKFATVSTTPPLKEIQKGLSDYTDGPGPDRLKELLIQNWQNQ